MDYIQFLNLQSPIFLGRELDGASSPIYVPSTIDLPIGRSIQKVAFVRKPVAYGVAYFSNINSVHHGYQYV